MDVPLSVVYVPSIGKVSISPASPCDRNAIIQTINAVASEYSWLQAGQYCPTPTWEKLLSQGVNSEDGLLLLVCRHERRIVGFGRLSTQWDHPLARLAGDIGLVLLPRYRCNGIGAIILKEIISFAPCLSFEVLMARILETNVRSLRLFLRHGFRSIRTQSVYLDYKAGWFGEVVVERSLLD